MRYFSIISLFFLIGCISTKSTIQNIDNTAVKPEIKEKAFVFSEYANNQKYGFDADFPINIGLIMENQESLYISYFFNGLEGPKGEKIIYKKLDTCCPFPTQNSTMGAGTLVIYEVIFDGTNKKNKLYFNIYEKGKILCPNGFSIKKISSPEN